MRRDQLILERLRTTRLTDRQILLGAVVSTVTPTGVLVVVSAVAVHLLADVPLPRNPAVFAVAGSAVVGAVRASYGPGTPGSDLAAAVPTLVSTG